MDEDASSIPPDHQGEMAAAESSPSGDAGPPRDRGRWSAQHPDEEETPGARHHQTRRPSHPGPPVRGAGDLRRQGPGDQLPPHRAVAAAVRRPQRPGGPARRRRLRRLQRLRRAVPDPDRRTPGRRRPQVHPVPHHGAVLTDAPGAADRPQPPRGRHGRHHRDRHVGARLQLDAAEHLRTARGNPQVERLFDGAVRQMPRSAGLRDHADRPVPSLADGLRLRTFLTCCSFSVSG